MHFKELMNTVKWKLHLRSDPEVVFLFLTTAEGREKFWAEKAPESNNEIHFIFPNGASYHSKILHLQPSREFHIDYFNSYLKIILDPSGDGGTDLTLTNEGVGDSNYLDTYAGWVSVLLNLKAVIDYEVDLRNHKKNRTWDQNFVDN